MTERVLPLSICCAIAVLSALGMVMARRLVRCAALLLVHSLAIAATYFVLTAEFLAMGQVVVYTGAIVVLFLFVVLLLPDGGQERTPPIARTLVAVAAGAAMLGALLVAMQGMLGEGGATAAKSVDLSTSEVAKVLFGLLPAAEQHRSMLVPFELTALLLLIAILGAVTLWHRQSDEAKR